MSDDPVSPNSNFTLRIKKNNSDKMERDLRDWLKNFMKVDLKETDSLQAILRDGVLLCDLINKISPNSISKVNRPPGTRFKEIENISNYLHACEKLGMEPATLFDTTDLVESKSMTKVYQNLLFIKKHTSGFDSLVKQTQERKAKKLNKQEKQEVTTKQEIPNVDVSNLASDVAAKEELKYNSELERMARKWIEDVLSMKLPPGSFHQVFKSGVILCELINKLKPGTIQKINKGSQSFQQMENIGLYIQGCQSFGLTHTDTFDTPDLYEAKGISSVINNIHVLAKHVSKNPQYRGPKMEEEDFSKTRSLFSSTLINSSDKKELVEWVSTRMGQLGEVKEIQNLPQLFWLWFICEKKKHVTPLQRVPSANSAPPPAPPTIVVGENGYQNETSELKDWAENLNIPDEVLDLLQSEETSTLDLQDLDTKFKDFMENEILKIPDGMSTDELTLNLYLTTKGVQSTKSRKALPLMHLFSNEEEEEQQESVSEDQEEESKLPSWPVDPWTSQSPLIQAFSVKEDINKRGLRRSKKIVQMEDAYLIEYPFLGDNKVGIFCIFDGHAGKECAEALVNLFPQHFKNFFGQAKDKKDLSKTFSSTYHSIDQQLLEFEYLGCTATTVCVWQEGEKRYIQSANVGDSSAFLFQPGNIIPLSKDHKATSKEERERVIASGINLGENATRIGGLGVSRAFGDHFLKKENLGIIVEPFVSPPILLDVVGSILIVASDGLWDVISPERAMEIVTNSSNAEDMAIKLRGACKASPKAVDNISIIVVTL